MGSKSFGRIILFSWLAGSAWGCAADPFESGSVINSLRVLAVQKQPSYGKPGTDVELTMLLWDGKADPAAPRPIQFAWFGRDKFACINPEADLYYGCYSQWARNFSGMGGVGISLDAGVSMPSADALSSATEGAEAGFGLTQGVDANSEPAQGIDASSGPTEGVDASSGPAPGGDSGLADANSSEGLEEAGALGEDGGGDAAPAADAADAVANETDASGVGAADAGGAMPSGAAQPDWGHLQFQAMSGALLPEDGVLRYSIPIPSKDIITRTQSGATPYGLAYAFFAVCAGELRYAPGTGSALPLSCFGSDQTPLGPSDFVTGFTSIYVYDELKNQNPIITGFSFDNRVLPAIPTAAEREALTPHVPRCTASDSDDCPKWRVQAIIDPASAEVDPDAKGKNGELFKEQMWVSYNATAGGFKSVTKLVNDATQGWNAENETEWRTPLKPGPARIWAIVHDSRGGVAWAEVDVIVDP